MLAQASASVDRKNAEIRGTIRALESGEPLGGTRITIVELSRETIADSDGRFRFSSVPLGRYSLTADLLGRAPRRMEVEIDDLVAVIDVTLAGVALDAPGIHVALDRFQAVGGLESLRTIPGSAHVLDARDLAAQNLLFDDVHGILRQVPGLNIQEEEGYGLRPNIGIRGTGSERSSKVTLMEDGVLIAPAPYAAPAAYYFPVAGRMEAIEVRKGSSQIKYGPHTIGGAINLVSSAIPDGLSWTARAEGGGDRTGNVHFKIGDSSERFGWLVETYQIHTDGFKRIDGGGDAGFQVQDYLVKLRASTAPSSGSYHEAEVKLGHYDEKSFETYLGLTQADFAASPFRRYAGSREDVMNADHDQVQLRHFFQRGDRFDLTTVVYVNEFDRNWYKLGKVNGVGIEEIIEHPESRPHELAIIQGATSEPGALNVRANNRGYSSRGVQSIVGVSVGSEFDPWGRHEIEVGVRYHRDEEDRFQHEDLYQMIDGRMELTLAGDPGSQSNRIATASAWSVFAQDRFDIGRWSVAPGLRFESIDFKRIDYATDDPERVDPIAIRPNSVSALIPGVGATYWVTEALGLFVGAHKGFGPPGPGAHEDTEAESSVNYEMGGRYTGSSVYAQVVAFFNDYDNILGKATLSTGDPTGSGETFNGGAVVVKGLEVSLEYDPLENGRTHLGFPVRLAYTYTDAEFRSDFESDYRPWGTVHSGDKLPYIAAHQLSASVGAEWRSVAVRLGIEFMDEMRTEAGRGEIAVGEGTDSHTLLSLNGEHDLGQRSAVFFGIQNLTDETYIVARRPAGARPGLPRTFLAGIRLSH